MWNPVSVDFKLERMHETYAIIEAEQRITSKYKQDVTLPLNPWRSLTVSFVCEPSAHFLHKRHAHCKKEKQGAGQKDRTTLEATFQGELLDGTKMEPRPRLHEDCTKTAPASASVVWPEVIQPAFCLHLRCSSSSGHVPKGRGFKRKLMPFILSS